MLGRSLVFVLCLLVPCLLGASAQAAERVSVFDFENEDQRARYQALIAELRCPKCLNTNIAGSDAPIAQDLRRLVHQFVVIEDRSDEEILAYLHERYGDFVLYDPPFNSRTWLLWLLPLFVGALVLLALFRMRAGVANTPVAPLSAAEKESLQQLQDQN